MDLRAANDSESRFAGYIEGLVSVIGHADRAGPLRDYCVGLMLPCERKSVEPMAAVTAPERTAAQHQSLLHFVGNAGWSDEKVLAKVSETVLPEVERHGPIEAWIIDDTGFPKQGRHSVGVARQYCGQLGKQDNCQVAVSLSVANHHASLPVAYRLYLPKDWAKDRTRRRKAGVRAAVRRAVTGRGADGCRLWCRHRCACEHHDAGGIILRSRHYAEHDGLGTRHGAAAAEEVVRSGTPAEADPSCRVTISRYPFARSRGARRHRARRRDRPAGAAWAALRLLAAVADCFFTIAVRGGRWSGRRRW